MTIEPTDAPEPTGDAADDPGGGTSLGRRVLSHVVLASVAGGLVFLIEAFDRLRVLRASLDGPPDALRLVLLLGATVLFVAVVASTFGVGWTLADGVRHAVERRLGERFGRWRKLAALLVAAAAVSVVARILSGLFPWALQNPTVRLIRRIDNRLFDLGIIGEAPKVVFTILLCVAVLAVMAVHVWLFSARGRRSRVAAIGFAIACFGLVIGGYYADSRVEFTRYEFMFHIPAEVLYSIAAMLALLGVARVIGVPERVALARPVVACALAACLLGAGSVVFGAVAMDDSQGVKALFWYRSVIARRVFQLARFVTDRDGDGFSARFGAGDPDDGNPDVHPMAPETPGNGIDDNGIGGDLSVSGVPRGALHGGGDVSSGAPTSIPSSPVRNILVLSIDCLRADHLGAYGHHRPTSPNIDAFAAESLLFEHAYAQGTNTGHSFTSMYRSSYADDIFDDRIPTFAAELARYGYEAQFLNAIRTDAWLNAQRWGKYKSLMDDFEVLHDDGERFWNAEVLTDQAIAALDAQPRDVPHLTWVHYFDCHRPRRRHAEHDFGRSASGVFDSNVAFVDRHLGRLFDHLRATGRLDDTIVFITADHGEAFGEHGAMDHSNKPYENNTLVPLIVRVPGGAVARFAQPVGLIDVGPTALGFAGIPVPPYYRGLDLAAYARTGQLPTRPIISETPRNLIESSFYSWALVEWPLKVIWDVRSNTTEVFDLSTDPGEVHNLADRDPGLAARMRQVLGEWIDRETARTGAAGPGDEGLTDDE